MYSCLVSLLLLSSNYITLMHKLRKHRLPEFGKKTKSLPTYLPGEPGRNPQFYFGRAYQGAQGRVYPYPSQEFLTDDGLIKHTNSLILKMSI